MFFERKDSSHEGLQVRSILIMGCVFWGRVKTLGLGLKNKKRLLCRSFLFIICTKGKGDMKNEEKDV